MVVRLRWLEELKSRSPRLAAKAIGGTTLSVARCCRSLPPMSPNTAAVRPFRALSAAELRNLGRGAYERRDTAQLRQVISELETFRSTGEAYRVSEELTQLQRDLDPGSTERSRGEDQDCRNCGTPVHGVDVFYCRTCWPPLWDRIERDLTRIIEVSASTPYVGRTAFPERRLLQHLSESGRERLSIVHWADSLEEAEDFEQRISQRVRPRSDDGGRSGRFSRGHHAVYLSWRQLRSPSCGQLDANVEVRELPGLRCWPTPAPQFHTVHLISHLDGRRAESILERFADREADFLQWRRAQR